MNEELKKYLQHCYDMCNGEWCQYSKRLLVNMIKHIYEVLNGNE